MKTTVIVIFLTVVVTLGGCALDLGGSHETPAPAPAPEIVIEQAPKADDKWCCSSCATQSNGDTMCNRCDRNTVGRCAGNKTLLVCRSSYREREPGINSVVTCF